MTQTPFNPEQAFTSLPRALQDYIRGAFDPDIVEVQMSFPDLTKIERFVPLPKTIVHLELDDDNASLVGFGRPGDFTSIGVDLNGNPLLQERVADALHIFNYDVGIWASAESGGETSRMEVHGVLSRLLTGPVADDELAAATNGIHLQLPGLQGGKYITDTFNDVPIWRAFNIMLSVRVYTRRAPQPPINSIEEVEVILTTTIDGEHPPVEQTDDIKIST